MSDGEGAMGRLAVAIIIALTLPLCWAPAALAHASIEIFYPDELPGYLSGYTDELDIGSLYITTDGCRYRLSNDGHEWTSWQSVSQTAIGYRDTYSDWSLEAGSDGVRTIYADPEDGSPDGTAHIILDRKGPKIAFKHAKQSLTVTATDSWSRSIWIYADVYRNRHGADIWVGGWDPLWCSASGGVASRSGVLRRGEDHLQSLKKGLYEVDMACCDGAGNASHAFYTMRVK